MISLIPTITKDELIPIHGKAGVRAQAVDQNGKLIDDFPMIHNKRIVHVLNNLRQQRQLISKINYPVLTHQ